VVLAPRLLAEGEVEVEVEAKVEVFCVLGVPKERVSNCTTDNAAELRVVAVGPDLPTDTAIAPLPVVGAPQLSEVGLL
jgi:hypothetical protein